MTVAPVPESCSGYFGERRGVLASLSGAKLDPVESSRRLDDATAAIFFFIYIYKTLRVILCPHRTKPFSEKLQLCGNFDSDDIHCGRFLKIHMLVNYSFQNDVMKSEQRVYRNNTSLWNMPMIHWAAALQEVAISNCPLRSLTTTRAVVQEARWISITATSTRCKQANTSDRSSAAAANKLLRCCHPVATAVTTSPVLPSSVVPVIISAHHSELRLLTKRP